MSHARIGKITLKASGTEVRVLHNPAPNEGENWRGTIIQHARMIAEHQPDNELCGFVIVAMFDDGGYSSSCRMGPGSRIGRTALPAYVGDIVRRDFITTPLVTGEIA